MSTQEQSLEQQRSPPGTTTAQKVKIPRAPARPLVVWRCGAAALLVPAATRSAFQLPLHLHHLHKPLITLINKLSHQHHPRASVTPPPPLPSPPPPPKTPPPPPLPLPSCRSP
ncbi:hypothetical protein E2C01_009451 [Portunus trituberculatus]|uniref:Uncharacterized protein n=1 Tax=Portunus trituberculatus TaxID=210409 RepID=A0A5B7D5T7_PORTR|nr:hypothetical protein [Portunus trituberculatus]